MVGTLNRHGFQQGNVRNTDIRARRIFCDNRNRARGCGRTFSIWTADQVKRLYLRAHQLWQFLEDAASSNNKFQAFRKFDCDMSDSAPYRIWRRFQKAQTAIRTALAAVCPPPNLTAQHDGPATTNQPTQTTLAHLRKAFGGHQLNPVAAFAVAFQAFLI